MEPAAGVDADTMARQLLYVCLRQVRLDGRVQAADAHGWEAAPAAAGGSGGGGKI